MHQIDHKSYGEVLDMLFESTCLGKTYLEIGSGLSQRLQDDPFLANTANVFWTLTTKAHLSVAQLEAFKLFDSDARAITVEYALATALDHPELFPVAARCVAELVQRNRCQVAAISTELKQVRAKRNRLIAHADRTIIHDPQRLLKECAVTAAQLNRVFQTAEQIVNEVGATYGRPQGIAVLMERDDFENVLQAVIDAKHNEADRWAKDFGVSVLRRPSSKRSNQKRAVRS